MYVMIKLSNSYGKKVDKETWDKLASIPQLAKDMYKWKEDGEAEQSPGLYGEYLIDMLEDAPILIDAGMGIEVLRFKNTYIPSMPNTSRYDRHQGPSNPTIQISIPNVGLLSIEEVQVLEDACTDELQGFLDKGWRIVAVCPPNAARRPDYVLGRAKSTTN